MFWIFLNIVGFAGKFMGAIAEAGRTLRHEYEMMTADNDKIREERRKKQELKEQQEQIDSLVDQQENLINDQEGGRR